MTPERTQRALELFQVAVELSADEREQCLEAACAGDDALRAEVESLLAYDNSAPLRGESALGEVRDVAVLRDELACERLPIPERIGRYQILGVLGSGATGLVYRARQENPERLVALKVLRPGLGSGVFWRRFQTEIRTLGRLRHPGIAQIFDANATPTAAGLQPYIVMELVEGEPLVAYAHARGLSVRARLELLAAVCDGVEHAHQRGVIHRDLKPANILVEERDGRPQPRILDFGVARLTSPDGDGLTSATLPGQLLGTLGYMSPEQVEGDPAQVDTRTDVYALGATAYEMLSGVLPIEVRNTSVFGAMRAIREQPPRPLTSFRRVLRGDVSAIVAKALAKKPDERYASAAELAADLRRYLAGEAVLARQPSALYVLGKFARRHRLAVGTVAVALLGLVGGAVGTTYGLVQARQATVELRAQFRKVAASAGFLTGDIVAHLDAIAGTTEVRRRLLTKLRTQLEDLRVQAPEAPDLLDAYAAVLEQQSDILMDERRWEETLVLRERALDLRRQLVAQAPDERQHQARLSIILVKIGDVCNARGEYAAALAWYHEAYAIDQQLVALEPESRWFLDNLAWSFNRLGDLAYRAGDYGEAESYYQRRLTTTERLWELAPGNLTVLHGLWQTHWQLAGLAQEAGRDAEFREEGQAAVACAEQLVQRAPQNRLYQCAFASSYRRWSEYLACEGDLEAALSYSRAACRAARELHRAEPADTNTLVILFSTLDTYARQVYEAGDVAAAHALAAEAQSLVQAVSAGVTEPSFVEELSGRARRIAQAVDYEQEAAVRDP